MTIQTLPNLNEVATTFAGLLGRDVDCKEGAPFCPKPDDAAVIGAYANLEGKPAAFLVCDIALAAMSGAALTMIPLRLAEQCMRAGKCDENIFENFEEILNIGSQFFSGPEVPPVKLRMSFQTPSQKLPKQAIHMMANPDERFDLDVNIDGYGVGRMALLIQ